MSRGRAEFNEKLSRYLAKRGFEETHWGGNTWGYQREDDVSVISIAEEDGMTDPVTITVDTKTYDAYMKASMETVAEFYFATLRAALDSMRLF
jgi:hypothetical protein